MFRRFNRPAQADITQPDLLHAFIEPFLKGEAPKGMFEKLEPVSFMMHDRRTGSVIRNWFHSCLSALEMFSCCVSLVVNRAHVGDFGVECRLYRTGNGEGDARHVACQTVVHLTASGTAKGTIVAQPVTLVDLSAGTREE